MANNLKTLFNLQKKYDVCLIQKFELRQFTFLLCIVMPRD